MASVLLLREHDRCEESASRLRLAGHEAVILPLLEYVDTGTALPPGPLDAVAFTSAAALSVLARRDGALEPLLGLPALCVGHATADAAHAAGFGRVEQAGGDGESLARLVSTRSVRDGLQAILYPAPVHRAFDLAASVPQAGIVAVEVYEAVLRDPGDEELDAALARSQAVFLHSPRTASHFAGLLLRKGTRSISAGLTLIAISEKTARAAREVLDLPVLVAGAPEEDAMIALLQ